jgi:ketosteroid isomerase-like protein
VAVATPSPVAARPPGRAVLRLAGVLSQLSCGVCLLIGTIGLVLVQHNQAGSLGAVGAWLATAMAGLVFGGLIYRGGVISILVAAAIDVGFGVILIAIEYATLRQLLRILPASDVTMISDGLDAAGIGMLGAGALCLVALPQGVRFARWFRAAAATRTAMSTARGFPPPAVSVYGSAYVIPAEDHPASRRRLYMVLGGIAIGVGAGVGVLVSSTGPASPAVDRRTPPVPPAPPAAAAALGSSAIQASPPPEADPGSPAEAVGSVQQLIAARRDAIARGDIQALADLVAPAAFGFGIDADEVAEGQAQLAAQLARDLGEPPAGGFTVESKALSIGGDRGHAWIAEDLELSAAGHEPRQLAISELAAVIDGRWRVVALHWATPVADATAERLAILHTLPRPQALVDRHDRPEDLDRAARAAFASRAAFAEAHSQRADAFNYGSGGERAQGGVAIKRIFRKLRAQIRIRDGVRVFAGSLWDPAQQAEPWIGFAALNVDFTAKTRAATDFTQTFRVLAILIKEDTAWKIVQTQWSNGGPIR